MFWTQAKHLYLNFNLSIEYRMYANRIRIQILKLKFENSNFVSHPYMKHHDISISSLGYDMNPRNHPL